VTKAPFYNLLIAMSFAFTMPLLAYVIGIWWSSIVARVFKVPSNPRHRRAWTAFCLASPIILLFSIAQMGFEDLELCWIESPIVTSAVVFLFFVAIPTLLVKRIIGLWRRPDHPADN